MEIRLATPSDASAIAKVHVRSWRGGYRGLLPASFLASQSIDRRERMWQRILGDRGVDTSVAMTPPGTIVGFSSVQPSRDTDALPLTGELTTIYVDPDEWGRGYGRRLLDAALERARRRKFDCLTLWVLESNQQARRFYKAAGFGTDGARKTEERTEEVVLQELRYRIELADGVK